MKKWLLLLALAVPAQAEPYSYAPVYAFSGAPGVMVRAGSFRHKAVLGYTILYCMKESATRVTVVCVVRSPKDHLVLMEREATEHNT